jgi:hypothetical protein
MTIMVFFIFIPPKYVKGFPKIKTGRCLSFDLAIEESLRRPSSYVKLRTSLYTSQPLRQQELASFRDDIHPQA